MSTLVSIVKPRGIKDIVERDLGKQESLPLFVVLKSCDRSICCVSKTTLSFAQFTYFKE